MLALDEPLARKVGAVAMVAIVAAIGFVVFVADRIEWGRRVRIAVYFEHTGGLREGAPVIVGGREIGDVESIGLAPRAGDPPAPIVVTLALARDRARELARGGAVFISGRGPLAARHVEFAPSPQPDGPRLEDGDRVRGVDPPTLDRALQRTWDNLTAARAFAEQLAPEFRALRTALRELAAQLDQLAPDIVGRLALAAEVSQLSDELERLREVTLGGSPGIERARAVIEAVGDLADRARATIATVRARVDDLARGIDTVRGRVDARGQAIIATLERALDRARAALANVDPLLAQVAELRSRIERGEGSLGRLTSDPEFPEDAKELGKILKRTPWRVIARPKDQP